jgi:hypothetical protein
MKIGKCFMDHVVAKFVFLLGLHATTQYQEQSTIIFIVCLNANIWKMDI